MTIDEFIKQGLELSEKSDPYEVEDYLDIRTMLPKALRALDLLNGWMQAYVLNMDCRGDEDCDHCDALARLDEIEKLLAEGDAK